MEARLRTVEKYMGLTVARPQEPVRQEPGTASQIYGLGEAENTPTPLLSLPGVSSTQSVKHASPAAYFRTSSSSICSHMQHSHVLTSLRFSGRLS